MSTRRSHWIPVVAAFLKSQGKLLVGQRPEDGSLAGQWEFPGGKIELGESPEQALARELREELSINATIGPLRLGASHAYGETGIIILFYDVVFWKGEPKPVHHMNIKWIEPDELRVLPIPEANAKILDKIIQAVHQ